jgi:hypothetical protein
VTGYRDGGSTESRVPPRVEYHQESRIEEVLTMAVIAMSAARIQFIKSTSVAAG